MPQRFDIVAATATGDAQAGRARRQAGECVEQVPDSLRRIEPPHEAQPQRTAGACGRQLGKPLGGVVAANDVDRLISVAAGGGEHAGRVQAVQHAMADAGDGRRQMRQGAARCREDAAFQAWRRAVAAAGAPHRAARTGGIVVMQRLHHRDAEPLAGGPGGDGEALQIVAIHHVGPDRAQCARQPARHRRVAGVDCLEQRPQRARTVPAMRPIHIRQRQITDRDAVDYAVRGAALRRQRDHGAFVPARGKRAGQHPQRGFGAGAAMRRIQRVDEGDAQGRGGRRCRHDLTVPC